MKIFRKAVLMATLLALVACTGGPPKPDSGDPDLALPLFELPQSAVKVLPNTKVSDKVLPLSRARIEQVVLGITISPPNLTIIFDKNALTPAELNKLVPGNIIVAQGSLRYRRGILRKIVNTVDKGSQLQVETTRATLAEVFTEGGFWVQGKARLRDASHLITPSGRLEPLYHQPDPAAQGLKFPVSINVCPVNLDNNKNTKNDQVCVTGSVDLDLDFDITLICEGFLCSKPYFDTNVSISQAAKLTVESELTRSVSKTFQIGTVPLGSFAINIVGIPLVFVAEIDFSVTLDGDVTVKLKYTADQELEYTAGVEFENGKFKPYDDMENTTKSSSVTTKLKMSAKATLSAEASVLVYGLGGPTLTVDGWVKLKTDPANDPTWTLTAGLDLKLGVELEILGLINLDWNGKVLGAKWEIDEEPNTKPTVILKYPVDGQTVHLPLQHTPTIGYFYSLEADAKTEDAQEGANCCTVKWYINNQHKANTIAGSGHKQLLLFTSPGTYTVKLEVTDLANLTSTKTYDITIKECQPIGGFCAITRPPTLPW
jgi:hypothetical protein